MEWKRLLQVWASPLRLCRAGEEPHLRRSYLGFSCACERLVRCLPFPRALVGLKRFLDVLLYWEVLSVVFGCLMSLLHICILSYTTLCEAHASDRGSFYLILCVLTGVGLLRVLCCCVVLSRVRDLKAVWWSRSVLEETIHLLKSAWWQLGRLAASASFCAFFAALHVMYADNHCDANAPVLCKYMSVLVLCFLSLLGPNVVLFLSTVSSFLIACFVPDSRLADLFVDEPVESYSLPGRMLERLKEEPWSKVRCTHTAATDVLHSGTFDAVICSICLCEFQPEELIRTLPCGHIFHSVCITRWFKSHASCPLRCHINFNTGQIELPKRRNAAAAHAAAAETDQASNTSHSVILHVAEDTPLPPAAAATPVAAAPQQQQQQLGSKQFSSSAILSLTTGDLSRISSGEEEQATSRLVVLHHQQRQEPRCSQGMRTRTIFNVVQICRRHEGFVDSEQPVA
ncbi:hypothetical protein Esti_002933 [Eimeria stiedai]